MRRKVLSAAGALLLLLIVTNPGVEDFRSYLHQNRENVIAGRDVNFFVFSLYSNIGDYADSPHNGHSIRFCYIGVFGNSFPMGSENLF
ncbi:MAG TPA: hypothetical protein VG367_08755 [Mucilaginibacter sp.]|jgi:hypothetical protein|nr:hypothetical protein [Mucilaginibacter sp.]